MPKMLRLRDLVGRLVRSREEITTRGGDIFPEFTVFVVTGHWRGKLMLEEWDGRGEPEVVLRTDSRGRNLKSYARGATTGRGVRKVSPISLIVIKDKNDLGQPIVIPTPSLRLEKREYMLRLSHPELMKLAPLVAMCAQASGFTKPVGGIGEPDPAILRVREKLDSLVESARR
jgi:hypothetical protein